MADHKDDEHGGGWGQKVLIGVGIAAVTLLALRGLADTAGVNVNAGNGYAGVTWSRPGCGTCGVQELTPADYEMLRRAYR